MNGQGDFISGPALLEQTNPGAFTINRLTSRGMEMLYASPDAAKFVGMEQDEYLSFSRADTLGAVLEEGRPIIAAEAGKCLRGKIGGETDWHGASGGRQRDQHRNRKTHSRKAGPSV